MANEAILKYLVDTNRPYSCADVTVNLRGAFTKGAVQKALDALSENGKIKCKLYGKQKVYAAIQPDTDPGDSDVVGTNLICILLPFYCQIWDARKTTRIDVNTKGVNSVMMSDRDE